MDTWSKYVAAIVGDDEHWRVTQERSGVSQATMSRWRVGEKVPDKAAVVAYFARAYSRNPLEAFVAAGMLTIEEAGDAISRESVTLLRALMNAAPSNGSSTSAATPSSPASRLVALIDEYQNTHGHASDAWIANQIELSAGKIKSWRKHGLKQLPREDSLRALARVIGKPDDDVLYAAGFDVGQILEVPSEDEGPESVSTAG